MSSPALDVLRGAAPVPGAWLVGGSVRDLLLDRPVTDIDLVVDADPQTAARAVARERGGAPFPLSERHGAWRVVQDGMTVDITGMRGERIEDDLGERDFTVNAMALPLAGGDLVDPFEGRSDLDAGRLRIVAERVFDDDPLRLLRLGRLAHELGMQVEPSTAELARARAHLADQPSGERIYVEMRRLLAQDDPAAGVRVVSQLGVLDVVIPELAPTRGVEQSPFHHLDVYEHTLHVLDTAADIAANPAHYLPGHAEEVAAELARPVGDELDEAGALRLAALFHDIRKPQTKRVSDEGRISFMGHDREGAETAVAVLGRWRASAAVGRYCRLLVAEHLRLGFMIRDRPLDRRAAHRYLRATAPHPLASIVLSLADRLATRGVWARQSQLRAHSETASELVGLIQELPMASAEPLLRGDEIAAAAGVSGSRIAELVEELAEEQAAGTVTTREQAVAFVSR
jgi:poly(A) polymerase